MQHQQQQRNFQSGYPVAQQPSPYYSTTQGGYPTQQTPYYSNSQGGYPMTQQTPYQTTDQSTPQYGPGQGYNQSAQSQYSDRPETNESDEPTWDPTAFQDKEIRRAFIKKVLFTLMIQLTVTFGIIMFFSSYEPVRNWIQHEGSWFYWVSYGVFFVTYITLVCCPGVRRRYPWNYVALVAFTLSFSYVCATISSYYAIKSLYIAAGITAGVCLALTIFATQTKIDFTRCSGLLCGLMIVLVLFGIACGITWHFDPKVAAIMQVVYGALGALVMSMFLVFDIQLLMGGKTHEISPEDYIYAAVQIYVDVVYLFMHILQLVGFASNG